MFNNIGGNDLSKFINVSLNKLVIDEAAQKFSWFGLQENISVKKFLIMRILKGIYYTIYKQNCH